MSIRFSFEDLLKQPNIYFVIIFLVISVWSLTVSMFILPSAKGELERNIGLSKEISGYCKEIFTLEPTRLSYAEIRSDVGQFSYTSAVDKTATKYSIKPADYDIRTEQIRKQRIGKTQGATVTIQSVDIARFAGFLSELLEIWPDLKCDNLRLNSNKDKPDDWRAIIRFTYSMP